MFKVFLSLLGITTLLIVAGSWMDPAPQPYHLQELAGFPKMPENSANPLTVEGVKLGRYLFYDPILSRDSSTSCASCHQQRYAFSGGPVRFNKGIDHQVMARNTLPLFNLAWYDGLFWDGRAASIEAQVLQPVAAHNEMDLPWPVAVQRIQHSPFYVQQFKLAFGSSKIDSQIIAKAIAQFERSLISHNSKFDQVLRGETYLSEDEFKGFELMNDQTKGDCLHCHITDAHALGTNGKFSNNGLDRAQQVNMYPDPGLGKITGNTSQNGQFKIPSLRNIALTAPYMHDGRFQTLEQVLEFYSQGVQMSINIDSKMGHAHQGGVQLSPKEQQQIIAFLKTLTDRNFIENPAFSNPFIQK